ncbi:unnamed protein product [Meloidogyne enterolobii]|uniref:Uncharacterized protein n=1 Tax=Meloidogyne enterolobii TaxID=390850 RepID=A0ACB0ZTP4_MELEN
MIFIFWHAKMQNFTPPMMEFFKYMGGGMIIKGNFSACLPKFKNINIMPRLRNWNPNYFISESDIF